MLDYPSVSELVLGAGEFVLGVAVGIAVGGLLISVELGPASAAPAPSPVAPVLVPEGDTDGRLQWLEERVEFLERAWPLWTGDGGRP